MGLVYGLGEDRITTINAILRLADYEGVRRDDCETFGLSLTRTSAEIALSGSLPAGTTRLFGRDTELEQLTAALRNPTVNVVTIIGGPGEGKTTLLNAWLQQLLGDLTVEPGAREQRDHTCPASADGKSTHIGEHDMAAGASVDATCLPDRVYIWSFYGQGMTEQASSDSFVDDALSWFAGSARRGSPRFDKASVLAERIASTRSLLVLDGIEVLQRPPGSPGEGLLRDDNLRSLLRRLALRNSGLCLITSRLRLQDLETFDDAVASTLQLRGLQPAAGADLMKWRGVRGEHSLLEEVAHAFGGNAFALDLLASFLTDALNRDGRRWREVGPLVEDARLGGHAKRVMESYRRWFGLDSPEVAALRLLGVLDHQTDAVTLRATVKGRPLPPPLNVLAPLRDTQWAQLLSALRRAGLVNTSLSPLPDSIDVHPLVADFFGSELRREFPEAWRAAHARVYEQLAASVSDQPSSATEALALYSAVRHGCRAGRAREVLARVYRRRLLRGEEAFSIRQLGLFGEDVFSLYSFFEGSWEKPTHQLTESESWYVMSQAGTRLRWVGRLLDSIGVLRVLVTMLHDKRRWREAAAPMRYLSEGSLLAGHLTAGLTHARAGITMADRSRHLPDRVAIRTILATIQHQLGCLGDAERTFRAAESLRQRAGLRPPILLGLEGARYCEYLLDVGRYAEVCTRTAQMLKWAQGAPRGRDFHIGLVEVPLCQLIRGQALLHITIDKGGSAERALIALENAVTGLRKSGRQEFFMKSLLARGEAHIRLAGRDADVQLDAARVDLGEALCFATNSDMRLLEADCEIAFAQLHIERGDLPAATTSLEKARRLVQTLAYHRRDDVLARLAERLSSNRGH